MRLRHQQEQVFLTIDAQRAHGPIAGNPSQREIEQNPEILVATAFCSLKGLNQMTKFSVKQRIHGRIRFRRDHLGALEQVTIDGPSKIDSGCHR